MKNLSSLLRRLLLTTFLPSAKQIRIGRLYLDGTDPRIDRALDDALIATGFQVVPLNEPPKPELERTSAGFRVVADGWLSDRQYLGKPGVTLTTQATIRLGELQYNTTYKAALKGQRGWQKALSRVLQQVDFIALPTLQNLPPRKPLFGRWAIFEARLLALQNTGAVNYAGNPAIAIPIPLKGRGFPVTSLQLIGPNSGEAELVNAARLITLQHQ